MKRLVFILIAFVAAVGATAYGKTATISDSTPIGESLNYRVMYKWGLVNKQAGHVNLSTKSKGNGFFQSKLVAATEKWADRIYKVRDTLQGTISIATCEPNLYEKITHEGGEYKYDRITYDRSGNSVVGHCTRIKQKKEGQPFTTNELTLTTEGLTLDMLSAFYYMRRLDYANMTPGETVELNVFSGKRKELLTITYHGRDNVEINKKKYSAYHITFKFTGEQGKKTSDDMDAWISTDSAHIPLKLEGKLAVGKVQCFYIP